MIDLLAGLYIQCMAPRESDSKQDDSGLRVSQGFWGTREHWQNIEGNKGTLANFWEQGNKIRKITLRKHSENVWEYGNIGQFWKGTREQGPPWETLRLSFYIARIV